MGEPEPLRVLLDLTRREAEQVRTALKHLFSRSRKKWEINPDFVPEPGHYDVNKNRMKTMHKFIRSIDRQLGSVPNPDFELPFKEKEDGP